MDANKIDPDRQALYRRFGQIGFLILVQAAILFLSAGKLIEVRGASGRRGVGAGDLGGGALCSIRSF